MVKCCSPAGVARSGRRRHLLVELQPHPALGRHLARRLEHHQRAARAGTSSCPSRSPTRTATGAVAEATARVAATLASNAAGACGSICAQPRVGRCRKHRRGPVVLLEPRREMREHVRRRAPRWLKRSAITIGAPDRPPRRYQSVCSSLTVGVVKLK